MRYLKVLWLQDHPGEPIELYSELDDGGWERRKVEVFRDGSIGFASASESGGTTTISERPLPSIEEIAADPQFRPSAISKAEFERVWERRLAPAGGR
jgi:hypothetical protein